jgi:hypothetical protein
VLQYGCQTVNQFCFIDRTERMVEGIEISPSGTIPLSHERKAIGHTLCIVAGTGGFTAGIFLA